MLRRLEDMNFFAFCYIDYGQPCLNVAEWAQILTHKYSKSVEKLAALHFKSFIKAHEYQHKNRQNSTLLYIIRGNSNTNFDFSGILPPINGQHPRCLCCRIQ